MQHVVNGYFFVLKCLLALLLIGMVVLVFGNVVLRYGFNQSITASEELSRFFFIWMTFLGAIVAMREHGHLGVDALIRRLPRGLARLCLIGACFLMLLAVGLMLKGSWLQAAINLNVTAPVTGISMAWFYGAGVVFAVSGLPIILLDLWKLTFRPEAALALSVDSEDLALIEHTPSQERPR